MTDETVEIALPTEDATTALAKSIAPRLSRGDTILLSGPIGVGKTAFARALIRARLGRQEDVPSPTFTLVQTYEDQAADIWHADLYRLTHPDEALELGLEEAFSDAICLIEWPDRLGDAAPKDALQMTFATTGAEHMVTMTIPKTWRAKLDQLHG